MNILLPNCCLVNPSILNPIGSDALVVYMTGQSNGSFATTQYSGAGEVAFETEALNHFDAVDYRNTGIGGSTLATWVSGGVPQINGTNVVLAIDAQQSSRSDVDVIIWNWGEANGATGDTKAYIKSELLALFTYWRAQIGSQLNIIIDMLGRRTTDINDIFWQNVKDGYFELIAENSWIYAGAERYDLVLADAQHLNQDGYEAQGRRQAKRIAAIYEIIPSPPTLGPSIISAEFIEPDVIDVTIAHSGGTDFTPSTAIEGIELITDNVKIAGSVTRQDATTARIILEEGLAPTKEETAIIHSGYGQLIGLDNTKVIKDNGANTLPLQTGKVTPTRDAIMQSSTLKAYIDPRGSTKTYVSGTQINTIQSLAAPVTTVGAVSGNIAPSYDSAAFGGAGGLSFPDVDCELVVGDLGTAGGTWTVGMVFEIPAIINTFYFFGWGASGGATDAQALMFMTNLGQLRYSRDQANLIQTLDDGYTGGEKHLFIFEYVSASVLNFYKDVSGVMTLMGTMDPNDDFTAYDYIIMFNSSTTRLAPVGGKCGAVFIDQGVLSPSQKAGVLSMVTNRFNL